MEIPETRGVDLAFGNTKHLPKWEDIPEEFQRSRTKWNTLFSKLFYGGAEGVSVEPKEGVDPKKALLAVKAIMVSFEPKHEHKEAGCAYLLSQWFEDWTQDGPKEA